MTQKKSYRCEVSGNTIPLDQLVSITSVRLPILQMIKEDHPELPEHGYISKKILNTYRELRVKKILEEEFGELNSMHESILKSISNEEFVSKNVESEMQEHLSIADKISDRVAEFGGSWRFIISFLLFIVIWMAINVFCLSNKGFDPYPFILLNLILSCVAALQAPVIMMSQNRQEQKDRQRSMHDYQVNLKAEVEIQQLHEKLDHLMMHQNQRLLEIQQTQVDMLEQLVEKLEEKK